ncbi:receptor-like protein 19 [Trifolium pratense]|uniref:receptor-like protein 19 n=1 Tax=Trifolium pratense TaxID=57577 RepID=UPI001E695C04|nr:receptor-like protein 19 [Trifolium pratense]
MGWLLLFLHLLLFHFLSSSSSSFNFLCHDDESSALLQFKSSFNITTYSIYCDETASKTATWKNGTDCCLWHGVTCHNISGHVVGLNLICEGIKGEVPIQISHLPKLESLHLSENELVWKETTLKRLVQNATNLKELFLEQTDMPSIRPDSVDLIFNQSSSLVTLNLQQTGLSGKLKKSLLCLPNIQELDMSGNDNLEGQLLELSCSTSLRISDFSDCQFNGPIPQSFSNLTHLTSLILSRNNLIGSIPSSLLTLPHLTYLDASYNALSGQIPNVFRKSNRFQKLDLSYNKIGGLLPTSTFHAHFLSVKQTIYISFSL